jgi:hypothetical protein
MVAAAPMPTLPVCKFNKFCRAAAVAAYESFAVVVDVNVIATPAANKLFAVDG